MVTKISRIVKHINYYSNMIAWQQKLSLDYWIVQVVLLEIYNNIVHMALRLLKGVR